MSSIRLIINADDLGSGSSRDRGILLSFREGVVTSASLLSNGPTCTEAARAALAEGLPLGVHLNLSEGRPLSGPLPGLTTPGGDFPGKAVARRCLASRLIAPADLERELSAQIRRVVESGIVPDHLDTHQHIFLIPPVTAAVLKTAELFQIGAVRLPCPAEERREDPGGEVGRELGQYRDLSAAARDAVRAARVSAPEGLWGMPLLGRLDESTLAACLRRLTPGTWELMVHPGYAAPGDPFGGSERERELAALTSPNVRSILSELKIALINFRELACAS